jgi:uncharacterized protein involved in tolerance to divalent cations
MSGLLEKDRQVKHLCSDILQLSHEDYNERVHIYGTNEKMKVASDQFDVFICYNRKDWASVETIAKKLVEKDIIPWVDIWNLRPGFIWQKELGHLIKTIKSAAIFIGKDKFGDWQEREVLSFLNECSKREFPVIPVFLEDSEETPDDLPPFLKNHTCVDFRIKNPDPIENLIFGITGTKQNQGKQ